MYFDYSFRNILLEIKLGSHRMEIYYFHAFIKVIIFLFTNSDVHKIYHLYLYMCLHTLCFLFINKILLEAFGSLVCKFTLLLTELFKL
jgi:hypothetical protein